MPYNFGFGVRLALALAILGSTVNVWSQDSPVPTNSTQMRPSTNNLPASPAESNHVVPVGYSPAADWRSTVVDQCEDSSPFRRRRTNPWLGRLHRKKPLQGLDWFHYIRGEGPAIWVHE